MTYLYPFLTDFSECSTDNKKLLPSGCVLLGEVLFQFIFSYEIVSEVPSTMPMIWSLALLSMTDFVLTQKCIMDNNKTSPFKMCRPKKFYPTFLIYISLYHKYASDKNAVTDCTGNPT